jgi:hypothetical protein
MKNKNPLYVVKGKTVLEASGMLDLIVKKLNLAPVIELLSKIFNMLLEQVKDYPTLVVIKKLIDTLLEKITQNSFFAKMI